MPPGLHSYDERAPRRQAKYIWDHNRLFTSVVHTFSTLLAFIAALKWRSEILVVFFAALQVCALLWYGSSYVPGGRRGMAVFTKAVCKTARVLCTPVVMLGKQCLNPIFRG